jgi:hypothetical protein
VYRDVIWLNCNSILHDAQIEFKEVLDHSSLPKLFKDIKYICLSQQGLVETLHDLVNIFSSISYTISNQNITFL